MAPGDKRAKRSSNKGKEVSRSKRTTDKHREQRPDRRSPESPETLAGPSYSARTLDNPFNSNTGDRSGYQYPSGSGTYTGSSAAYLTGQFDTLSIQATPTIPTVQTAEVSVRTFTQGDVTSVSTRDRATGLTSAWSIGPAARKVIRSPSRDDDDPNRRRRRKRHFEGYDYEPSSDPELDYSLGRVIEVLMVPPPPEHTSDALGLTYSTNAPFIAGTRVQKRRYVVIRPATPDQEGFCALPIKTYNGRGVDGQTKWHHCIIYTNRPRPHSNPPLPTPRELPQRQDNGQLESPMQTQAILVEPRDRRQALDSMSRLDFFDIHEFECDFDLIRIFGKVHRDSRGPLLYQYEAVRNAIQARVGVVTETPLPTDQLRAWYNSLHQRAVQLGLTPPRPLSEQEFEYLSSSHNARIQFSNRLQQGWAYEQQQLIANRQDPEQGRSDDDQDSDDNEHSGKDDDGNDDDDNDDDDSDDNDHNDGNYNNRNR